MRETMFFLAENYKIGIYSITGLCIVLYVAVSVFSVLRARKLGRDVAVAAMIPFLHLKYIFCKPKIEKATAIADC